MSVRFLHSADLHLDTPFTARARYPEHVAAVLRDASLTAFERLVAAALAHQVGFLVVAGDVYDGAERGVRAQLRFRDGLEQLSEAGIRSFVAHGNHDPVDEGWSAIERFPDLVQIFPPSAVASHAFEVEGEPVTVHGISYGVAKVTENLARRFRRPTAPGLHVGVLHANVGHQPGHDPYSPCTVEDLVAVGMHYWALGHIHTRKVLHRDPWIVYPGNLQGRSIKAAEGGPKGALLVEAEHGRIAEPTLLAFDVVRFASIEVDASGLEVDGLLDALAAAGEGARADADGRSVLLSARVTGRGGLHERLRSTDLVARLLDELRGSAGTAEPFLWWDALTVATRPEVDLDELRLGDGFLADLLATRERVGAGADDPRPAWASGVSHEILRAAGLAGGVDLAELWAEATDLAIDLLVDEQP
jgi:DNA repair exonuclease SbcCD nuclease subunit